MRDLLRMDLYHAYRGKWIWLCAGAMVCLAAVFCVMQATAMDYTVALDRVIFLPMSFYGIANAVLVSIVIGTNDSDGILKNKIVSGKKRTHIALSGMLTSWAIGLTVYLLTLATSYSLGLSLFKNNVPTPKLVGFVFLGMCTCLAYSSLFCAITMLIGKKAVAVATCSCLAFGLLFLSLHTNSVLAQDRIKDAALNPHYLSGLKRMIYEILHDVNPTGQAAQLSEMKCLHPVRFILTDIISVALFTALGMAGMKRRDI